MEYNRRDEHTTDEHGNETAQSMPHENERAEAERQSYQEYNFKTPEYDRGQNWGYPPYTQPPKVKKEHPVLKELGIFTAKVLIASVIGAVALGGTLTAVSRLTGYSKAIEQMEERQSRADSFPDFRGEIPGFGGNDDSDEEPDEDDRAGRGRNSSDEDQAEAEDQGETDGPKLGVTVTTVTDDMIEQGYPAGVMIAQITKGGDADQAGLKEGDIITAFDGSVVKSNAELAQLVQSSKAGKSVKVVYKRLQDGAYKAMETTVTFSEKSASETADAS